MYRWLCIAVDRFWQSTANFETANIRGRDKVKNYKFDQYLAPLFRHAYNLDCNLALLPNFLATSKGVPRRDSRSLVGKIQVLFNHMPERERENLMGNLNYLCITLEAYIEEPSIRNYSKIQACVIDIKMSVCRITAKLTAQVRQDYDFQSRFPFPFNI